MAQNGGLPRRVPAPYDSQAKGCHRFYMVAVTVFASATLATLLTFLVLNILLTSAGPSMGKQNLLDGPSSIQQAASVQAITTPKKVTAAVSQQTLPVAFPPPTPARFVHPYAHLKQMYTLPNPDTSPRCQQSHICDGDISCGPDGLGCVTKANQRQNHVRKAIAWSWEGYRKYAWGHDEVDITSKAPHAWFKLGLTIVDSLDTILIAGLQEEYQQARHWVANHLIFHDGSSVQFFEVNIRILGGLLSAYYLTGGDELYLEKANQLADRLMVAFNTTSGIPTTFVQLRDAAGRAQSGNSDTQTNVAEAGTISMEFTTAGRLLGRDDMFDAGMQFWYAIMTSQNFSGIYCMGIHTSNAGCADPKITIGSAADSMYEYMLKQWLLSSKTQEVSLISSSKSVAA
eukprot:GHRR01013898.1.p1 GENE.GHRR01013898.1~~GHRR01013898.1.p1  ORF type:complete len:400 (+),score=119.24 GHRR01013898.1:453-1652(+)